MAQGILPADRLRNYKKLQREMEHLERKKREKARLRGRRRVPRFHDD
ncbi:MAG TPA: hypothetical protein VIK92_03290 [Thermaerobacter sp.]